MMGKFVGMDIFSRNHAVPLLSVKYFVIIVRYMLHIYG